MGELLCYDLLLPVRLEPSEGDVDRGGIERWRNNCGERGFGDECSDRVTGGLGPWGRQGDGREATES